MQTGSPGATGEHRGQVRQLEAGDSTGTGRGCGPWERLSRLCGFGGLTIKLNTRVAHLTPVPAFAGHIAFE